MEKTTVAHESADFERSLGKLRKLWGAFEQFFCSSLYLWQKMSSGIQEYRI